MGPYSQFDIIYIMRTYTPTDGRTRKHDGTERLLYAENDGLHTRQSSTIHALIGRHFQTHAEMSVHF